MLPVFLMLAFIAGAIFGSFGNVLIARLPLMQSIGGRSQCPHCNKTLRLWHIVPIFSFCFLRAKCAHCKQSISWQYPLVEIGSGLLFALALWLNGRLDVVAIFFALALWLFFLISVIDAKTQSVPDALSGPFVVLSFFCGLLQAPLEFTAPLLGAGFFTMQWLVSKGKWVGTGDIILGLGIGFLLIHWQLVLICLLSAYIIGSIVAVLMLALGTKSKKDHLAFGPFLFIGTLIALLWGDALLQVLLLTT